MVAGTRAVMYDGLHYPAAVRIRISAATGSRLLGFKFVTGLLSVVLLTAAIHTTSGC